MPAARQESKGKKGAIPDEKPPLPGTIVSDGPKASSRRHRPRRSRRAAAPPARLPRSTRSARPALTSAWASTSSTWLTGDDLQPLADIRGDLGQILLILGRNQHLGDAAAQRREQFLLEAADRQHPAAKRDLAGHGDVAADRNAGQSRDDRGDHADAGRGSVLRAQRPRADGRGCPCGRTGSA